MSDTVHVFVGTFASDEEARAYTEARWEPEPDEGATEAEFAAWEDRNPLWPLSDALDAYLDSDFIETISSADRYLYLERMLVNRTDLERVTAADSQANTLVLIFSLALDGFDAEMKSTDRLIYCGEFPCALDAE